jgi:protein TonB
VDRQPELVDPVDAVRIIAAAYPPLLRDAGISGQATVEMVVGSDGLVTQARAVSSSREEFARAAVSAASRLHFRPARRNGRTVAVRLMLPVSFTPEVAPASH